MTQEPNIVLVDIETSPITAYTWATYDTNVLKVLESSKIISVAWKNLYGDDVTVKSIADYPDYKAGYVEDRSLVKEVWDVLDKADIVIAHHGDAFDIKKLNARFVYHGLTAPSSYKTVDTKKVASRYFKFDSNSLNNLGQYFGLGKKLENGGFDLWVRCIAGEPDAWLKMKQYNAQDVLLLEKVYLKLRPFMSNHPNLNLITEETADELKCQTCQSEDVVKRGFALTTTGRKQRFQCNSCGSWGTGAFHKVKKNV